MSAPINDGDDDKEINVSSTAKLTDIVDLSDWSGVGKGFRIVFDNGESVPLKPGRFLGRGVAGEVYETTIRGVRVANKRIIIRRKVGEKLKREVEILKEITHIHIVKIVGAYTQGQNLSLLSHPVALCDLETFFEDVEGYWSASKSGSVSEYHTASLARLKGLDYFHSTPSRNKATPVYSRIACITSAIAYLHESKVKHKDLKPSNILLSQNGIWLAGFGSALDYSLLEDDMDDYARVAPRYCAPEVAARKPNGRAADIFQLGCILLEIVTLHEHGSLDPIRQHQPLDPSFYVHLDRTNDWLAGLSTDMPIRLEIRDMLSVDPNMRPTATELLARFAGRDRPEMSEAPGIFRNCCRKSLLPPEPHLFGDAEAPGTSTLSQSSRDIFDDSLNSMRSQPPPSIFDSVNLNNKPYPSTLGTSDDAMKPEPEVIHDHRDDDDTESTYSTISSSNHTEVGYVEIFAHRLIHELKVEMKVEGALDVQPSVLDEMLKAFAGRLHEESVSPFQWEASATLHRKRE
ncbi:kinase-like protein [Ophiobolus disseminans]|uniref:non-specific serine/threonine protein kinase n=1 Tax=Ophiobolus disseminans TaxID=1469910 RepID=A0A6A6ZHS1_9PLEO|nr:kinase-like protein [Ophiobolus disseminans]